MIRSATAQQLRWFGDVLEQCSVCNTLNDPDSNSNVVKDKPKLCCLRIVHIVSRQAGFMKPFARSGWTAYSYRAGQESSETHLAAAFPKTISVILHLFGVFASSLESVRRAAFLRAPLLHDGAQPVRARRNLHQDFC